jgi:hypothetical protein
MDAWLDPEENLANASCGVGGRRWRWVASGTEASRVDDDDASRVERTGETGLGE